MRQKRVKQYRKLMHLYNQTFGFREPYQLLVDSAFVQAFVDQKLDFEARMKDVLQGNVKPMITQCCITALYDLGPQGQAYADFAKQFERRKCGHFKQRTEHDCLVQMAGQDNKNRYVFATQDAELRTQLRTVPAAPIVYVSRSVVLLETPSKATVRKKMQMELSKLHASKEELALLSGQKLPKEESADEEGPESESDGDEKGPEPVPNKKKRKGPPGPNPLSVKKKKKQPQHQATKKRQREDDKDDGSAKKAKVESMPRTPATAANGDAKRKRKRKKKHPSDPETSMQTT